MHKVYLKPGKEESLKRFHPWIFSGAISRFDGEPEEGEVVEVYTSKKVPLESLSIRSTTPIVSYTVKVTISPDW